MRYLLVGISLLLMSWSLSGCIVRTHHPRGGVYYNGPRCHQTCGQWGYRNNCYQTCALWRNGYCISYRNACSQQRYCVSYVQQCN